jgi:hypothetical protein
VVERRLVVDDVADDRLAAEGRLDRVGDDGRVVADRSIAARRSADRSATVISRMAHILARDAKRRQPTGATMETRADPRPPVHSGAMASTIVASRLGARSIRGRLQPPTVPAGTTSRMSTRIEVTRPACSCSTAARVWVPLGGVQTVGFPDLSAK